MRNSALTTGRPTRGKQLPRVAVVGPRTPYAAAVRQGFMAYTTESSAWLVHNATEVNHYQTVAKWSPQALLVCFPDRPMIQFVRQLAVPTVSVGGEPMPDIAHIGPDNVEAGRRQARHLIERGFRHLYYMKSPQYVSRQRSEGFVAEAQAADLTVSVETPFERGWPEDFDQLDAGLAAWLGNMPQPSALACFDDTQAYMVAAIGASAGIAIPEHIALIGCNNDPDACTMAQPSLSSVDMNFDRIGYEAGRLLQQAMDGACVNDLRVCVEPGGVVTRQSTDTIACDDPVLVNALRFINGRANQPTSVEDVLDHVNVSRRTLEMKFNASLGHSPLKSIQQAHLRRACELLRTTDQSMASIARLSGYTSAAAMSVMFRKLTGRPPTAYRMQFRKQ